MSSSCFSHSSYCFVASSGDTLPGPTWRRIPCILIQLGPDITVRTKHWLLHTQVNVGLVLDEGIDNLFVAIQGASKPSLRDVTLGVFMFLIWDSGAAMGSVIGEGALVRYSPRFPNPKKARTSVGSGCMATVCCPKRLHF